MKWFQPLKMIVATLLLSSSLMMLLPSSPPPSTQTQLTQTFLPFISVPSLNPKKGLGVALGSACADMLTLRTTWYTNWMVFPDATCSNDDPRFIPRIYDANNTADPYFSEAIRQAQNSGWLVGFNEPNLKWMGNVSPEDGAGYWKYIEDTARPLGIKLVSPSPNPWPPGMNDPSNVYGHQWTWAMVEAYEKQYQRKPHFDALSWHIYKADPQQIKDYLIARRAEALARGYDQPFWIMEYSGACWNSQTGETHNEEVMREITAWFDQTEWIARYAWFANRLKADTVSSWESCSLIDPETSQPTYLGQIYREY